MGSARSVDILTNSFNFAHTSLAKPESKRTLPLALFKCIKKPFIVAIVPRLFLIGFRYSQPILIKESIRFVLTSSVSVGNNRGYWLIVSAIAVYIGLAVSLHHHSLRSLLKILQISTAIYQQRLNKLKLMIRSALVGLIHDKTMNSPSIAYDNGESTTLMSTDADSLDGIAEMFHETWAQALEVVVGIVLLATEVGWIWPLPLFLIFRKSFPLLVMTFLLDIDDYKCVPELAGMWQRISSRAKKPGTKQHKAA